jgi:SRSO17 transposase
MTILDNPQTQTLLQDAELSAEDVASCTAHLTPFVQRYLPHFRRDEHRQHAFTLLRGKLTDLDRKTTEPIAIEAGRKRRPLQLFVGAGGWSDDAVRAELCRHAYEELADPAGVLVVDGHGVPKKGNESCGVQRQWCGRLGKVDNCQVGYFLAYVTPHGKTLLDARLYLPVERATDSLHRLKTHVPAQVVFQEGWRLSLDLLRTTGRQLPHRWVVGDDEFGRASDFRAQLRLHHERYLLDVPCTTTVRDLSERRPPTHPGGRERRPLFEQVAAWTARQPKRRWRTFHVADGEKGPRQVQALQQWVQSKDEDGHVGPRERLVVIRTLETKPETWYTLSNAHADVPLAACVQAHGARHGVEELFAEGVGQVGLNHYEVRSWLGWHHHMTLSLLALWFLQLERRRLGKKKPGGDGAANGGDLQLAAAPASADASAGGPYGEHSVAA